MKPPTDKAGNPLDDLLDDFSLAIDARVTDGSYVDIRAKTKAAIQQYLDGKVKEAQIKRLEAFLLAWSGDMSPEPLDSMRFQVRELKAELEGSE